MASLVGILDDEITNLTLLLTSVPFSTKPAPGFFLNIYRLDPHGVQKLRDQPQKFPVDAAKLLKLGILLGLLVRTLELDEELYTSLQQPQKHIIHHVRTTPANGKPTSGPIGVGGLKKLAGDDSNLAFLINFDRPHALSPQGLAAPLVRIVSLLTQLLTTHQAKFAKNLLTILRNFDIGTPVPQKGDGISHLGLLNTINQLNGYPQLVLNALPIKLNLKQLLIEKLEINIALDTFFIYKTLFKVTLQIFQILRNGLVAVGALEMTLLRTTTESDELLLIFLMALGVLSDLNYHLLPEEYVKLVKQIVQRLLFGLVEPFTRLIFTELVEQDIHTQFTKLLNSL